MTIVRCQNLWELFTVREIGEKYDLQVLRFFMLNAHYRSPLNFSAELMEASSNALERIVTCVEQLKHYFEKAEGNEYVEAETALVKEVEALVENTKKQWKMISILQMLLRLFLKL